VYFLAARILGCDVVEFEVLGGEGFLYCLTASRCEQRKFHCLERAIHFFKISAYP
jgi:hypothetical protein